MIFGGILLLVAGIFGVMAVLIYRGNTSLIHDYHQGQVQDKVGYGKAFGKAMGVIAVSMALSGGIALFGEHPALVWSSLGVLLIGLGVGIVALVRVQKKYNGGMFG